MKLGIKIHVLILCVLLSLSPQLVGCGETRTMPEENNLTSEPAAVPVPEIPMPTLEKFIFEPDEFTDAIVPRRLKSTDVANFLLKKVKKDTSLESWRQVEKAADFYDTTEVPAKYRE